MFKVGFVRTHSPGTGLGVYSLELIKRLRIYRPHEIDDISLDYSNKRIIINKKPWKYIKKSFLKQKYLWYWYIQKDLPKYEMYHLTNQNISFMKLKPKIVTCYDIFHVIHPRSIMHKIFGKFIYSGLRRSEHIIAGSKFTQMTLVEYYKIPVKKITVIYAGVDESFKKYPKDEVTDFVTKFSLNPEYQFILHISNEQPHKNFESVIKAFYILKKKYGMEKVLLLKAGKPQYKQDSIRHMNLVSKLGLVKDILFLGYVLKKDLPLLYNISDVFVFPSFYEGFGLPPLEAMACGTPVITSNTSSLPEVVGDGGIMVDPTDINTLAKVIYEVLTNEGLRDDMIQKGFERAKMFSWEKTARETLKVYEQLE